MYSLYMNRFGNYNNLQDLYVPNNKVNDWRQSCYTKAVTGC